MYIWSMSKWQLVGFGEIRLRYSKKDSGYNYHVEVLSKNVIIADVHDLERCTSDGYAVATASAGVTQCVNVASYRNENDAIELIGDIVDAYASGVKVYSVSDRKRYGGY